MLSGGNGSDLLTGGTGLDDLRGGAGGDTFVFRTFGGQDIINDFNGLADVIELVNSSFASAAEALAAFVATDDGLVLQFSETDRLLLAGTTLAQLGIEDIKLTNEGQGLLV